MTWRASVLTLFAEMFPGPLGMSLAGRALSAGHWSLQTHDLRAHGIGPHRAVDDTPFGGGAGMVMRADIIEAALSAHVPAADDRPLVYLTPRGRRLEQSDVARYAEGPGIVLLCGRYEGVDERVLQARAFEQVSIGDYVLSGGEPAALVLLDAIVRLLPGVMGSRASLHEESFSSGLLEYPHYTRPADWHGCVVPDALLSGNHAAIALWRREAAARDTAGRRPDLWERYRATSAAPSPSSLPTMAGEFI